MGLIGGMLAATGMPRVLGRAGLGLVTVALGLGMGLAAYGQALTAPPPIRSPIDANGVDVLTGTFNRPAGGIAIGSGKGAISYELLKVGAGWLDSAYSAITISGSTYTVSFGGHSESFTLSGGVYTPAQGQGSQLAYNSANNQYTYTAADGTVAIFISLAGITFEGFGNYILYQSTTADGVVTTYSWQQSVYCPFTSPCPGQQQFAKRFLGLSNNLGYSVVVTYQSNTLVLLSDVHGWLELAKVTGVNSAADNCFPNPTGTCGTLSTTYPSLTVSDPSASPFTVTDALSRTTTYSGTASSFTIQKPSGLTLTVSYNASNQVQSVSNGTGTWTYGYSAVGSTETTTVTDPLGHVVTYVGDLTTDEIASYTDHPTSTTNRTTSYAYDSFGRLTQITYPLGNAVQYAYDARGNIKTTTQIPVTGSGLSNIVSSASFDATCTNPVKCNRPNSTTDGNGKVTNYTYDPTYGVLTKVDPPLAQTGATQSETRYGYTQIFAYYYNGGVIAPGPSAVHMLTSASTCQTTAPATCPGTVDEVKTTITYGTTGVANNLLPTSVSKGSGSGSLTATSSQTYDQAGDPITRTGPLGTSQKTVYTYDYDREPVGVFGPNPGGGLPYRVTRYLYVPDGIRYETDVGTDTSQTDSGFATFTLAKKTLVSFDGIDRTTELVVGDAAGTIYNLTQYYYDSANRLTCSIVRMNASNFGSLYTSPPASCGLSTAGPNGNDRITQNSYDNADQLTQVTVALSDTAQATYATYTYDPNGKLATLLDANNNLTTNVYDGLDRLTKTEYPVTTKGADSSDTTDYEAYTYDKNGNRLTVRRRSGDTITFTYDALNRVTEKQVPTWSGQNVFYGYDLLNRVTAVDYGSLGGTGVSYTYDALSRKTGETAGGRTISSQYDLAGDRTRITWPDNMYEVYVFDVLQRPTKVEENGATSGVGLLATYTYDGLGHLSGITRGNGANSTLGYDSLDRVTSVAHSFVNTTANVTWTFTYDPANGILTRTATNDAYTSHPGALSLNYTANGLNQYSSVSGTTYSYDTRGNLTSDAARTFTYDVDNKLLTGSAPTAATFTYDPLGRMQTDTASGATTTFLYDGDNLSAEYNSSGAVLRRYAPSGLGIDQPLVWYEGSGTTSRRWLHDDNQGSIIAYSDASGDQDAAYGYSPYGEPGSWSTTASRYAYTGQLMIPESLLYNYKARAYDPKLGRFLQVDPGWESSSVPAGDSDPPFNIDVYAYVSDDPIGRSDSSGMFDVGLASLDPGLVCLSVDGCGSGMGGGLGLDPGAPQSGNPGPGVPPSITGSTTVTVSGITITANWSFNAPTQGCSTEAGVAGGAVAMVGEEYGTILALARSGMGLGDALAFVARSGDNPAAFALFAGAGVTLYGLDQYVLHGAISSGLGCE